MLGQLVWRGFSGDPCGGHKGVSLVSNAFPFICLNIVHKGLRAKETEQRRNASKQEKTKYLKIKFNFKIAFKYLLFRVIMVFSNRLHAEAFINTIISESWLRNNPVEGERCGRQSYG